MERGELRVCLWLRVSPEVAVTEFSWKTEVFPCSKALKVSNVCRLLLGNWCISL